MELEQAEEPAKIVGFSAASRRPHAPGRTWSPAKMRHAARKTGELESRAAGRIDGGKVN